MRILYGMGNPPKLNIIEEMIEYYTNLAVKYGGLKTRYKNAICLVTKAGNVHSAMYENMASEPFIIT